MLLIVTFGQIKMSFIERKKESMKFRVNDFLDFLIDMICQEGGGL